MEGLRQDYLPILWGKIPAQNEADPTNWRREVKRSRLRRVSRKTRTQRWPVLKALREHVLKRSEGRCEVCHRRAVVEVHHVIKRSQARNDSPDNAIALCTNRFGGAGCHEATDRAYATGRLVITSLGDERFRAKVCWASDKWAARKC